MDSDYSYEIIGDPKFSGLRYKIWIVWHNFYYWVNRTFFNYFYTKLFYNELAQRGYTKTKIIEMCDKLDAGEFEHEQTAKFIFLNGLVVRSVTGCHIHNDLIRITSELPLPTDIHNIDVQFPTLNEEFETTFIDREILVSPRHVEYIYNFKMSKTLEEIECHQQDNKRY